MKAACRTLVRHAAMLFRFIPTASGDGVGTDFFHLFLITLDSLFKEGREAGHIFVVGIGA